jgi:hypothetical protein
MIARGIILQFNVADNGERVTRNVPAKFLIWCRRRDSNPHNEKQSFY